LTSDKQAIQRTWTLEFFPFSLDISFLFVLFVLCSKLFRVRHGGEHNKTGHGQQADAVAGIVDAAEPVCFYLETVPLTGLSGGGNMAAVLSRSHP
jgi:hypothetical protein